MLLGLNQQSTHTTKLTWMLLLSLQLSSRGYHVYKTSWIITKVGDEVTVDLEMTESSLETDPYACTIRIKSKYFSNIITVWAHPTRNFTACSLLHQDGLRKS